MSDKQKKLEPVRCSVCGGILTSPRSIRYGKGQRCRWKTEGRPTRKRTSNVSQGKPISDVSFSVTGRKDFVQMKLGDF